MRLRGGAVIPRLWMKCPPGGEGYMGCLGTRVDVVGLEPTLAGPGSTLSTALCPAPTQTSRPLGELWGEVACGTRPHQCPWWQRPSGPVPAAPSPPRLCALPAASPSTRLLVASLPSGCGGRGGRWCDPRLARPRRERPGSCPLLSWSPAAGLEPSRLLHQRREPPSCPGARGAPGGWSRGSAPARCHPRRTGWPQGPERQETVAVFSQ